MKVLRLGTVPYLNARPLVARFAAERSDVGIVEAVPSTLAGMLDRREVDAALVSSVVVLSDPSLCALPVGGVVSNGPVESIRLMSKVPLSEVRTLALDTSSRAGVTLARVMLDTLHGVHPEIVPLPPDVPSMLAAADACAIIGDPALHAAMALRNGRLPMVKHDYDLGSLWTDETGLPFVYALWTAHRDGDIKRMTGVLGEAANWGAEHLDEIADAEAVKVGLPADYCRRYLHENITFHVGEREWKGLALFRQRGIELGLLPRYLNSVKPD
jgi:chorismate dehydratase